MKKIKKITRSMSDLKFKKHTQEKLDEINYYYKTWFKIVKRQNCYIIDAYAGTGYDHIDTEKLPGSALLAVDLFKTDALNKFKLILIQIDPEQCELLKRNILDFISKNNLSISLNEQIQIYENDWVLVMDQIINNTKDGVRLFFLDPTGNKSLPWNELIKLVIQGKSEFGYKESGVELLINWGWHGVRRIIGKYFSDRINHSEEDRTEIENLNNFFGPLNWKQIANNYEPNIFDKNNTKQIEKFSDELVLEYIKPFFDYFKYLCIHPVYARLKTKQVGIKKRGKIVYYLIFASNYIDAPNIISQKFKEYINKEYYLPRSQKNLTEFFGKNISKKEPVRRITINDKIKNLQKTLKLSLNEKTIKIIKYLYRRRSYDYGCFDFWLYNDFNIDESDSDFKLLLNNEIIQIRKKNFKSGDVGTYLFLDHKTLVNRNDYLYFKDKIFQYKKGRYLEIQEN